VNILKSVDAIIIEANHDITMLLESDRSWYLKERILSPLGHMSNHICGQILEAVLNSRQQYVILAHISLECNSFEIIDTEIVQVIKKTYQGEIVMAEQFEATRLYQIK
jgi:phosphoribosyl 1,2-cyclic phosphodiesterase